MFARKTITSLLSFGVAALSNLALAESVEETAKFMFDTQALIQIINLKDQKILDAFQDIQSTGSLSETTFSLDVAKNIKKEEWDLDVFFQDEVGVDGFEGKNLLIHGEVNLANAESTQRVSFEVPAEIKVTFVKKAETDPIVLEYKEKATKNVMDSFEITLGDFTFAETFANQAEVERDLAQTIRTGIIDTNLAIFTKKAPKRLDALPLEIFYPLFAFRGFANFSEYETLNRELAYFTFSSEQSWRRIRPGGMKNRKRKLFEQIAMPLSKKTPKKGEKPHFLDFAIN